MLPKLDGTSKDEEVWKDVLGFEGHYQVSNLGRVKSLPRNQWKGRVLKEVIMKDRNSYARVSLSVHGKDRPYVIHQLVWKAFYGPIPDGLEINHKNGIKVDNRLDNLEIVTHAQNIQHAYDNNLITRLRPPSEKKILTSEQEEEIRSIKRQAIVSAGDTRRGSRKRTPVGLNQALAKRFGVRTYLVKDIKC